MLCILGSKIKGRGHDGINYAGNGTLQAEVYSTGRLASTSEFWLSIVTDGCILEMHRACPLQCSAEAEYFCAQAERVTSAEYFFSTTNDEQRSSPNLPK